MAQPNKNRLYKLRRFSKKDHKIENFQNTFHIECTFKKKKKKKLKTNQLNVV